MQTARSFDYQEQGLTRQQEEQYWSDGFLVINNVLTEEEIELLRQACLDSAVTGRRSDDEYNAKTVHLPSLTQLHPEFMKLARHPKILKLIIPLLGPDIQLQQSKLATKPPTVGKGEFPWHQDFAYFPHTNTDGLAVMVMLDDATPENGCMQMVKGSHRLGLLSHHTDGIFDGVCRESSYWEDTSNVQHVTPKAGGISIHHVLTLHGSQANKSGRDRRGLVYQYRADDAYQLGGRLFSDTGLLICGRYKEVVRCETGVHLLPKRTSDSDNPYGPAWNQHGDYVRKSVNYFNEE